MADPNCNAAGGALVEALLVQQHRFSSLLLAPNTNRGYRYDWSLFESFCRVFGLASMPADATTVALYVTDQLSNGKKVSTMRRRCSAIATVHRQHDCESPVNDDVLLLLRAATHEHGRDERVRRMAPLTVEDLRAICQSLLLEDTPIALRDRAIMVTGFASALRSDNLVRLQLSDLEFRDEGVVLKIGREKQDQAGKGREIALPHGKHSETCPVGSIRAWIARRGAFPGPLFTRFDRLTQQKAVALRPRRICDIVRDCVRRIGRNPYDFGSHSLRASFVSAAGTENVNELIMMRHTGHKDRRSFDSYFRAANLFRGNPVAMLDL